jgi:lycopene cyclase domain-containing protein
VKHLYLLLNVFSVLVPFIASFYPKAPFYKTWKQLWPALLIPALLFILWDEAFTRWGIWGFNPNYISGLYVGKLPLEEILFFICIPYACVFTYFALTHLVKDNILKGRESIITWILIVLLAVAGLYFLDRLYTCVTFLSLAAFLVVLQLIIKPAYLDRFYFTYLFILVPFFVVNGILTGSFIEGEVVWYNNEENLGLRLGTIPIEDVFYGMLLILMNVVLYEELKLRHTQTKGKRR